jgi:hypothetical protein
VESPTGWVPILQRTFPRKGATKCLLEMASLNERAEAGATPYASLELLSSPCAVGVCFVLAWVLTTPLRNVGWVFLSEVYRVLSLNGSLWNECLHQYQGVLRDAEVRQLEGLTYVYAVWGALFAVPMEVLSVNEEQYGDYGRMLRHWWVAAYSTFQEYFPDLCVHTAFSVAKYARVTRTAFVSCCRRASEGVRVLFLTCRFVVALIFFTPMAFYDLLEYCLLGEIGVAVTLLALNSANSYFHWVSFGAPATVVIVTEDVVAHLWRGSKDRAERPSRWC